MYIYFDPGKGYLYLCGICINSIHHYKLIQVTHMLYKLGKVYYISKDFEPDNGYIYQFIYLPGMEPVIPHICFRSRYKLMNQPD